MEWWNIGFAINLGEIINIYSIIPTFHYSSIFWGVTDWIQIQGKKGVGCSV
jgi:hypothetical protein